MVRLKKDTAVGAENGYALILTLIALSVVSVLGLALTFNGMTDTRIANNHEAETLAEMIAEAGLNRALLELRGRLFNSVLLGPNGIAETTTAQISAYPYDFRNPLPINNANPLRAVDFRAMGITNISQILSATVNDDGVIAAIGQTGVGYYVDPGPDGLFGTADDVTFFDNEQTPGPQARMLGRYFVKVTNNPEDAGGPFSDTDNTVIVRAMGIAKSMPGETAVSSTNVRNSISIIEARVRIDITFKTNSPFTVQGSSVAIAGNRFFDGAAYNLNAGQYLGLSVINTTQPPNTDPVNEPITQQLLSAPFASNTVGGNVGPPSIRNITGLVQNGQTWGGTSNPDVTNVLNPNYVGNLIYNVAPSYADQVLTGNQGCNAIQGTTTNPMFTYVCGNVSCQGNGISGAGLLIVTGSLLLNGNLTFNGEILVIGTGSIDLRGNPTVTGGVWGANLQCSPGGVCGSGSGTNCSFGTTAFTLRGNIGGISSTDMINLGLSLLPLNQLGWRQVHPEMEP